MGCLEKLTYNIVMRNCSFTECRDYVTQKFSEKYQVDPGYKIFDVHIIGVPPIYIGIEGNVIVFPFTKPCHGTFLVSIEDEAEALRIRKEMSSKSSKKR